MDSTTPPPLKVFVVEDSMLVRKRITKLIEPDGSATIVGEAEDVDTALEGILKSEADAVIVDLRLTNGHGIDLLHALARISRPIVTIVLTNYSSPAFREASFAAGADYFFDKTTEFDLARDAIARIARARSGRIAD
jgi:two-component system response regulator DevR